MKRITRAIVPSVLLAWMACDARATAHTVAASSKPCKKSRGNACPPEEAARASTTVASAEPPRTQAAALMPGGLRGRSAGDVDVAPFQCLDMSGAPLAVHSHNGHLYSYIPTMTFESWHDASVAASNLSCCQAKGRLLVANDPTEREFVKSSVVPKSSTGWIGLVDEANDGVWKVGHTAAADAGAAAASSNDNVGPTPENGNAGGNIPVDCGSDSNYDDKDYMYGVRCREAAPLAIIVEFDCSEGG